MGVVVTEAVRIWFPVASVLDVGTIGPGIAGPPENWKVPVIGGFLLGAVTVAVIVTL